jgi:hypothetical protein
MDLSDLISISVSSSPIKQVSKSIFKFFAHVKIDSRLRGNDNVVCENSAVIPAKAGIHVRKNPDLARATICVKTFLKLAYITTLKYLW